MKRRDFLRLSGAVSAPLLLKGVSVLASSSTGNNMLDFLARNAHGCGKSLVIIQQNGGNDGLNTIIPIDQYDNLANARSNIIIPRNSILPLANNANSGMHPAMGELRNLFDSGKVCIVQGVSYPNPNFSHFRATDIWFSGSASNQHIETGWLGRVLDTSYPNYPIGYPNAQMKDPVAVQIGSTLPFSLQGPYINMGYNISNPSQLLNVINDTTDPAPNNDYGRELTFLRQMKDQSNAYTGRITAAYNAQQTLSSLYPSSGNSLAEQLMMVARLIGGGLETPIYIVNHPNSHDTHENQVNSGSRINGVQANNLGILSKAINAFQDDIQLMNKHEKVAGMTFSEFGRKIKSNASNGTDHGTAAPVIFFGAALKGGMLGVSPTIPATTIPSDQVPMQYDYRQLYATVMQDWLCLSSENSSNVLGSEFAKLSIFQDYTLLPLNQALNITGQHFNGQSKIRCHSIENARYKYYALEFSTNGVNFEEINRTKNDSLNVQEFFNWIHHISAPKMYYRIKAENHQGVADHSNIILLRASQLNQQITVYPNPIEDYKINVGFFEIPSSNVDVSIYDLSGAKVYYNRFRELNTLSFKVPNVFLKGTHYVLEVKTIDFIVREQIIFK